MLIGRTSEWNTDAGVGIGLLVGPGEGCSECWLELAESFATEIGLLVPTTQLLIINKRIIH